MYNAFCRVFFLFRVGGRLTRRWANSLPVKPIFRVSAMNRKDAWNVIKRERDCRDSASRALRHPSGRTMTAVSPAIHTYVHARTIRFQIVQRRSSANSRLTTKKTFINCPRSLVDSRNGVTRYLAYSPVVCTPFYYRSI